MLTANIINAQSLIQKFIENKFVLSDSLKSPDGFYYGFVSYNLTQGSILMIHADGPYGGGVKPKIILRGPVENGKEAVPTTKFLDTTYENETNIVYILNKTGVYTIIIANGMLGKKGTIKTSIGLGSMDWLDNSKIFPAKNNSPFAIALTRLLRHAIFNFNLIKGEKATGFVIGRYYKNTFILPGADMGSPGTTIQDYQNGCIYEMAHINYHALPKKQGDEETVYDQKDSIIGEKKYDSLKTVVLNALPADFYIEREERYKLPFERGNAKNGQRIIFSNKDNVAIIDPANYIPELLASKKMKVELSLALNKIIPIIQLKIYSEQQ